MIQLRSILKTLPYAFFMLISWVSQAQQLDAPIRTTLNFDNDWYFIKEDVNGAEKPIFDDSNWRRLDVPHDWSIEGSYDVSNPTSRGGGYLSSGIGWYRKSFFLTEKEAKKKVFIEFDGVMANSDVWINGFHLGKRPYGYISFSYDLTDHLKFGKDEKNILSVRADNSVQPASRYYTGAGIYRHVRLAITNPLHIDQWGVYITSTQTSTDKALVKVETSVTNPLNSAHNISLETIILDPSGKTVATKETKQLIPENRNAVLNQRIEINNPLCWNLDQPNLYKAKTIIRSGKTVIDEQTTVFGIRNSKFESTTGYWLNGKNIKIKGVCLHHDAGALGSAVPLRAWERRLELLKQVGVNAIRTSHNPVAPEFLDLCDKMGFLVMDETFDTWTAAKPNGEKGYNLYFTQWWEKDTRDMVMRDRNHPSIIIYSVGNEIHDNLNDSTGFKKYRDQQNLIHTLDPNRPVTMALFRPGQSKVYDNGFADKMDIIGQNYRENELVAAHNAKPERIVIGTENGHTQAAWLALRDNPFMSGQFLWIGIDYLGEAQWPETTFGQGLFDRTGEWKQLGLQRQSWWSDKPVVHIVRKEDNAGVGAWVANWTPTDFGTYDDGKVQVYSNCEEVELFLNGKSLGSKIKPTNDNPRSWDVTFEKGSLKAIGKNKGVEIASEEHKTAGEPVKIILSTDRPSVLNNWDDLSYITVKVVDANGIICPNSDKLISFNISESGIIAAVDNGDLISHELYRASQRHLYRGQCIAIIKAKSSMGKITLKASSPGLEEATITLDIVK